MYEISQLIETIENTIMTTKTLNARHTIIQIIYYNGVTRV